MQEYAAYLASLAIGLSLGLIGAGGSILTIPVFVYILKKDPLSASVYSMFVVGVCSMAGCIRSIFDKLVDFKIALLFGIPSIIGVLLARKIIFPAIPQQIFSAGSFVVSKEILFMLCLAVLMFSAAAKMLSATSNQSVDNAIPLPAQPGLVLIQGLFVGIISGILGIGGGFLIVPALYFWANLAMKTAVGTTLLIITINSLFGFFSSYSQLPIDWVLLMRFSIGAVLGILIGTQISKRISGNRLKKMFGWFILLVSFYIIYKQFFL